MNNQDIELELKDQAAELVTANRILDAHQVALEARVQELEKNELPVLKHLSVFDRAFNEVFARAGQDWETKRMDFYREAVALVMEYKIPKEEEYPGVKWAEADPYNPEQYEIDKEEK
jgi:hypothetical protein